MLSEHLGPKLILLGFLLIAPRIIGEEWLILDLAQRTHGRVWVRSQKPGPDSSASCRAYRDSPSWARVLVSTSRYLCTHSCVTHACPHFCCAPGKVKSATLGEGAMCHQNCRRKMQLKIQFPAEKSSAKANAIWQKFLTPSYFPSVF